MSELIPESLGLSVRNMEAQDLALREYALVDNGNGASGPHSVDDLRADPVLKNYTEFDSSRGDYGLVVSHGTRVVGTAFLQFMRGHGFVADDIPELTVNVDADFRGQGLGTFMINRLANYVREQGWRGMSLFVERGNPARRLYARLNFVAQNAQGTMVVMLNPRIESVAVYCGSVSGEREEYAEAARELGRELARRNLRLIYGGGKRGLMGEVASACLAEGGKVTGVIPEGLVDLELLHSGLTDVEITKSMSERKLRMEELADAYIALPGGMGTLEELFQVLVRQQLGPYTGPFAFFNVAGFWTPMMTALQAIAKEGFIWERYADALIIEDTLPALFERFDSWVNPGLKWKE